MVAGRHVDDATGADVTLRRLECVSQLDLVGRAGALDRAHDQHQAVVGVAAEGRHVGLEARFVVPLVGADDGFLRVAVGQQFGHQQRRGGQAHAFGGRSGELDVLLGGDAVRLVQRQRQTDLPVVASHYRRPLTETGVEHRLSAAGADLGQLRGHVGVGGPVGLVGHHLDAVPGCDFQALAAHRLVEAAAARDQRHLRQLARLQVDEDLLAGHAVGVRRLEDPFLGRLDDHHGAGERDERRLRLFDQRHHRHRRAGRRAADDHVDPVLLEQPLGEGACLFGVAAVVVGDELQHAAEHSALGVDAFDDHLQSLLLGVAEECRRSGHGQKGADADRLLGAGVAGGEQRARQRQHTIAQPRVGVRDESHAVSCCISRTLRRHGL